MSSVFGVSVYFDGECPLCTREIRMLQRLDKHSRIQFVDISRAEFDPATIGLSMSQLMAEIHGRLPDGGLISGVEVFRRLYAAVGFSRLVAISRWPIVRQSLEVAYRLFAKNRMRLTGRCADEHCAIHARSIH
jgi:predicted DCC family thiol-disulfide oxidoreductase YuxK